MTLGIVSRGKAARTLWAASAAVILSVPTAFAGTTTYDFAGKVIGKLNQGTGLPNGYFNQASAALGAPSPVTGIGTYPGVFDPFNPEFDQNQIVEIGKTGSLTLQLDTPFTVANKAQLGVISNVGLIDSNYPSGHAGSPASIFGGGIVDVRVSSNGTTWKDLGNITFNLPASYWSKLSSPYETAASKTDVAASLSKPFSGKLSNFNGEDFTQILKTLNGSVGGTWLNVYGTGLKTVDYVQFRNPVGAGDRIAIDAVTISAGSFAAGKGVALESPRPGGSTGGSSSAVPLPPAGPIGLIMLCLLGAWHRLRRPSAAK